jgi:hypothetical protein
MGLLLWKAFKVLGPVFAVALAVRYWRGVRRDGRGPGKR